MTWSIISLGVYALIRFASGLAFLSNDVGRTSILNLTLPPPNETGNADQKLCTHALRADGPGLNGSDGSFLINEYMETNISGLILSCFNFRQTSRGRYLPTLVTYKTLIYAYAWTAFKWRDYPKPRLNVFSPKNAYGLRLRVATYSGEPMLEACIQWLLQEMSIPIDGTTKAFEEVTGDIMVSDKRYVSLAMWLEPSSLTANSSSAKSSASDEADIPVIKPRSTVANRVPSGPEIHLERRARSPISFDHLLTTRIAGTGPLVVPNTEHAIMGALVKLAFVALGQNWAPYYGVRSLAIDVVVRPTEPKQVVYGRDALDALIDVVDFQYAQKAGIELFAACEVEIKKFIGSGHGFQTMAALTVK